MPFELDQTDDTQRARDNTVSQGPGEATIRIGVPAALRSLGADPDAGAARAAMHAPRVYSPAEDLFATVAGLTR